MPIETIKVFCATEQEETEHSLDVDGAGELILTCLAKQDGENSKSCGRFLKYPAGTSVEQLKEHIINHRKVNEGQVPLENQEKRRREILAGFQE